MTWLTLRKICNSRGSALAATAWIIVTLSSIVAPPTVAAQTAQFDYFSINQLERDGVTVQRYTAQSEAEIRLPVPVSVRLWEGAPSLLNALPDRTINSQSELALFLVENGLAEVVDPDATPVLAQAEAVAKAHRLGLWTARVPPAIARPATTPVGSPTNDAVKPPSAMSTALGWLRASWKELAGAGIISLLAALAGKWAYRRFYVQRRVRLSVIGLPAAGKSVVLRRFRDPNVTEADILESRPTIGTERITVSSPIIIGKYEVHADLEDNPGESWGAFAKAMTRQGRFGTSVALLVLAPTDDRAATRETWTNQKFIDEQIGLAKALIGGCIQTPGPDRPALIIIYLNKFDLISDQSPGDSTARAAKEQFLAAFGSFLGLQVITAQAASKKPPLVKIIVGSALKNWGNQQIKDAIEQALYPGGKA